MKRLMLIALVGAIVSLSSVAQEVNFDSAKSQLKWTGKKVSGEHWGYINLKSGSISLKDGKIASGKFVIDMPTMSVKDMEPGEWHDKLLGHLKSDDFFSTNKNKEAVLVITGGEAFINGEAKVTGKLTIKGITHPIAFTAKKSGSGYTAVVTVDRTLYDIKYGSGKFFEGLGDKMIYDDFTLEVTLGK